MMKLMELWMGNTEDQPALNALWNFKLHTGHVLMPFTQVTVGDN